MRRKLDVRVPRTPQEAMEEAKLYLKNAREILSKVPIEYGRYKDTKKVKEASAIAYLSALRAIDSYLLSRGYTSDKLPSSIEEYFKVIKKIPRNGKLVAYLNTAYENLHILGYYRGGVNVDMIKAGIKAVEEIIKMLEK